MIRSTCRFWAACMVVVLVLAAVAAGEGDEQQDLESVLSRQIAPFRIEKGPIWELWAELERQGIHYAFETNRAGTMEDVLVPPPPGPWFDIRKPTTLSEVLQVLRERNNTIAFTSSFGTLNQVPKAALDPKRCALSRLMANQSGRKSVGAWVSQIMVEIRYRPKKIGVMATSHGDVERRFEVVEVELPKRPLTYRQALNWLMREVDCQWWLAYTNEGDILTPNLFTFRGRPREDGQPDGGGIGGPAPGTTAEAERLVKPFSISKRDFYGLSDILQGQSFSIAIESMVVRSPDDPTPLNTMLDFTVKDEMSLAALAQKLDSMVPELTFAASFGTLNIMPAGALDPKRCVLSRLMPKSPGRKAVDAWVYQIAREVREPGKKRGLAMDFTGGSMRRFEMIEVELPKERLTYRQTLNWLTRQVDCGWSAGYRKNAGKLVPGGLFFRAHGRERNPPPGWPEAREALAYCATPGRERPTAVRLLERAIRAGKARNEKTIDLELRLGRYHNSILGLRLGEAPDVAKAIGYYEAIVKSYPKGEWGVLTAHTGLASAYKHAGLRREAAKHYMAILDLREEDLVRPELRPWETDKMPEELRKRKEYVRPEIVTCLADRDDPAGTTAALNAAREKYAKDAEMVRLIDDKLKRLRAEWQHRMGGTTEGAAP